MKLKVIADQECEVYIDGSIVATAPPSELTIIPLEKGEYIIRYVCKSFPDLYLQKDMFIEYDKIERINFQEVLSSNEDLISNCDIEPSSTEDGLFGYVIKRTTLWVIPPSYDHAEHFRLMRVLGSKRWACAFVSNGGTTGAIRKDGSFIVPLGLYRTLEDAGNGCFQGVDLNGETWHLSSIGAKINKSDNGFLQLRDLIVLSDPSSRRYRACFLNGTPISDMGLFDECHYAYPPFHFEEIEYPYYIIVRDSFDRFESFDGVGDGIIMIDRQNDSMTWIHHTNLQRRDSWDGRNAENKKDRFQGYRYYCPDDGKEYSYYFYPYLGLLVRKQSTQPYSEERDYNYNVQLLNNKGEIIFSKDSITFYGFKEGLALFEDNDNQFLLSADGKITGPIGPFDFHTGFFLGHAEVIQDGKYGLIDQSGKVIIPCEYDSLDWESRYYIHTHVGLSAIPDYSPYVIVEKHGKVGLFDLDNSHIIIKPEYDVIQKDKTHVSGKKGERWDIFNYAGEKIKENAKEPSL